MSSCCCLLLHTALVGVDGWMCATVSESAQRMSNVKFVQMIMDTLDIMARERYSDRQTHTQQSRALL